jgi:hypothetical protein
MARVAHVGLLAASNGWLGGTQRADCKSPGFIPDAHTTSANGAQGQELIAAPDCVSTESTDQWRAFATGGQQIHEK